GVGLEPLSIKCGFYYQLLKYFIYTPLILIGKLRDMRHPSFTINKEVEINDYCTRRGVSREMAYRHIKERVRNS
ncbi:MAG: hypothetical protein ACRD8Z_23815, partial [Nitrososphaeraceae archaeon]